MSIFDPYTNLYKMDGKVAVIAGGGGGIGKAVSAGLAASGFTVVVADICQETAIATAAEIEAAGGKAWGSALDALNIPVTHRFMAETAERAGRLDVLVNCVGTHKEAPAEEYAEADWDRVFDVNLKAAFYLSQAAAKIQIPRGGGKHIHITSVRSLLGIRRGYVAYCASKGGLNLMIKQLATEWAKYNITVNGIAPTFTRTELVKEYLEDPNFVKPLIERIPLGRICEPLDVAALAVFLASSASDFISGQNIMLDGGLTATQ